MPISAPAGLAWGGLTPGLFVPVVGNVLVPLAGVPLGFETWAAAQMGIGVFFWPVLVGLLLARLAQQGPWPERLLPSTAIFLAPPSVVGLSLAQFGAPAGVLWALWGLAAFTLMWLAPLARRIAAQPFGVIHWSLSFPLAAFTGLTLRLWPSVVPGVVLLAGTSVVIVGLAVATVRGLRDGRLLAPETVPIASPAAP
jgi:tellurite resistance protein